MKTISSYSLFMTFAFLLFYVQIAHGQANDSAQKGCTIKEGQKIKWFDGKEHKIKNPKVKYRVGGILVYNDELHFVNKRLRDVDIYKFDFEQKAWIMSEDSTLFYAMQKVYKDKALASGMSAIEIVEDTLFFCGLNKGPFYAINHKTKEEVYDSKAKLPKYHGSNKEAGVAFSYPLAYIAFHSLDYKREIKETQRLFAIDVRTDSILFDTELNPSENRKDSAHGLTMINGEIWHMKDSSLVKMNAENGQITHKYSIEGISRPTSLCYYKDSFWVITYFGGLYEIPLDCQ